ncbi:MAG: VCBS repeat-containing protein, partial [Planctomycetota bacterium]|nr:VCBS repeat-containing protein [Planctomycetota bacterium]
MRSSVVGIGDVDGDGTPDFLYASRDNGFPLVWVLSGTDGSILFRLRAPGTGRGFGQTLSPAGDFDRDGFPDAVVGATSRAVVFSGASGRELAGLYVRKPSRSYGSCVAGGGDLDGDGYPEVVVGAPSEEPGRSTVWIHSGPRGRLSDVLVEDRASGGTAGPHRFGEGVAILPDIDGDSLADIAIGATHASYYGGQGYVEVRTGDGRVRWRIEAPTVQHTPGGWFGWNVASGGDVNADGTTDLLVTNVHFYVRAYSGRDGEKLLELDYHGGNLHAEGTSLDGVGDLNGDGHGDFLIAANETGMDCD